MGELEGARVSPQGLVCPLLNTAGRRGMRSVGISFSILAAKIALIVGFASLTDWAVGVAAVTALAALALDEIESDLSPLAEAAE